MFLSKTRLYKYLKTSYISLKKKNSTILILVPLKELSILLKAISLFKIYFITIKDLLSRVIKSIVLRINIDLGVAFKD